MREFQMSSSEFTRFFWPAFVKSGGSEDELERAVRVLRKVKEISSARVLTVGEEEKGIIPNRTLDHPSARLLLEEDEHSLVKQRLLAWIPFVSFAVADELHDFVEKVKSAERFDVQPSIVSEEEQVS